MTPIEFEKHVKALFAKRLKKEFHRTIPVYHQKMYTSSSGNSYQVDVSYSYNILDVEYLTLVECKYWNGYVPREKVTHLSAILRELKAHKGILVTTKGFQSGAIKYAQSEGIGLIKLLNNNQFEIYSNADGGLDELVEILTHNDDFSTGKNNSSVGLFAPSESVVDFIGKQYGQELAAYISNEFSPDTLDDGNAELDGKVKEQLQALPSSWAREYTLMQTAGLDYKLTNEPELRMCNMILLLMKLHNS